MTPIYTCCLIVFPPKGAPQSYRAGGWDAGPKLKGGGGSEGRFGPVSLVTNP